jgi:hypothetical protein
MGHSAIDEATVKVNSEAEESVGIKQCKQEVISEIKIPTTEEYPWSLTIRFVPFESEVQRDLHYGWWVDACLEGCQSQK